MGTDHAAVGQELALRWGLPDPLCAVMGGHHHPAEVEPPYRTLSYVVHLGDVAAMLAGMGTGADTLAYHLDEAYPDYVDVSRAELAALLLEVEIEFTQTKASLTGSQGA